VLNLPSVCNLQIVNDTQEDVFALKVGFMLLPNSGLVNGTVLWPSVGVSFSPYKMWIGQIKAYARTDIPSSVSVVWGEKNSRRSWSSINRIWR
jgi:hypothetical protein